MGKSDFDIILEHYVECWNIEPKIFLWEKGPIQRLPFEFRVLEFLPFEDREVWLYATCGMSDPALSKPIELHIYSSDKDDGIVELLTAVVYYHRNTARLDINHSVNFGRPWRNGSRCEYGVISLPYLDGPRLENLEMNGNPTKFYWLVPVTKKEVEYKKKYGMEALEERFERAEFNYVDPFRKSVV